MKTITLTVTCLLLSIAFNNTYAQSEAIANMAMTDPVNSLIKNEIPREASVMTALQMKELQNADPMLAILDIRDRESFELARINRAKHMGPEFTQEKIWMLKRNSNIIIYGDDNTKNEEMCKLMMEKGFPHVYYLNGSLGDLQVQGVEMIGDVEKSDKILAKKDKHK